MILFLYGDDSYRSKQKLDAIKTKYVDVSLGDMSLAVLDLDIKTNTYDKIVREVLAMPFLSSKRLVIVKNLFSKNNKELQEKMVGFLEKVPETTLLVFYESETPDKRTSLFKKLNKPASPAGGPKVAQEFKPLEGSQLREWIKNEVETNGGKIDSSVVEKLIEYVGNDLWRLSGEIKKLTSYSLLLTASNVELLVKPKTESNVFNLIDAIGSKNSSRAVTSLHDLISNGEPPLYIFTMIIYQFRNLLIIRDLMENSKSQASNNKQFSNNKFQIAKQSGLNPFVAEKTMAQTRNFTFDKLKHIYQQLLDIDVRIKIGRIDSQTALDILVTELCL